MMETKTKSNPTNEKREISDNNTDVHKYPYIQFILLAGLLLTCWIIISSFSEEDNVQHQEITTRNSNTYSEEEILFKEEKIQYQKVATWEGENSRGEKCSYTLLKNTTDGTFRLRENNTYNIFKCTKRIIRNSTDYYFVDPDIANIKVNLACFNLKKGVTIYIIHDFDYDSFEQKSMNGILVPFSDNNVRIYLDMLINGTAYYYNNGNPPISRINENNILEYYNIDGSNEPVYECYAKLH